MLGCTFYINFTILDFRFLHGGSILFSYPKIERRNLNMKKSASLVLAAVLAAVLALSVIAGCAQKTSGTVTTDGSTSMEKVIGALGEAFEAQNDRVTFTYNPTGSGSGIQAVLEGRCDIGLSSRDLKVEESAQGLTGTVLAYDGIAVIVNPDNPVSELDVDTIARIYTGEITNWKDIGGQDAEIVLIGREAGSGTRDGFESITGTADNCQYRQELTSTGDVITAVSQNPDAIGYASLASVKDTVRAVTVGGVAPTEDAVKDGSYVIQRPFVLVTKTDTPLSEQAQKFFDFATSPDAAELISGAGAVAAN
jgi:phosphate transport system substrate-binding protein